MYSLTVLDTLSGCESAVAQVFVDVNTEAPFAIIRQLGELDCYTSVITLFGTTGGNEDQFLFNWTQNGQSLGEEQSIEVTEGGWVVLSVIDTINGCPAIDSLLIIDKTEYPAANAGDPALLNCYQETAILSGTASNGPDLTYTWTGPTGGIISGENTLQPEVGIAGTYYFMVQDTSNGCSRMDSVIVGSDVGSPIAIIQDSLLLDCFDPSIVLDGSNSSSGPGISYQWTTIGGTIVGNSQVQNIETQGSGIYIQQVFDIGNGCVDQDTIVVYGPIMPDFVQLTTTPSCHDGNTGSIEVNLIEGGTPPYLIGFNGNPLTPDLIYSDLRPGGYSVTIQDINGCEWDTLVHVNELPPIEVLVTAETDQLDFGDSIRLQGQTSIPFDLVDSLYWNPTDHLSCNNCYTPWAQPFETSTYTFTVLDTFGCQASASLTLTVDRRGGVYIPDAFSPNGDGTNDTFTIYGGVSVVEITELRIFDRWGDMVYHRENFPPNDPLYGWDGVFREQPMNAAVFAFWTRVRFIDGTTRVFKGDLTLVR